MLKYSIPLSQHSSDVNHIFLLAVNHTHRTEVSRLCEHWWIVHSAIWPCKRLIYNLWQVERILGGWGLAWLVCRVIFLAGWFVILDCNNNVRLSLKSNNQYHPFKNIWFIYVWDVSFNAWQTEHPHQGRHTLKKIHATLHYKTAVTVSLKICWQGQILYHA